MNEDRISVIIPVYNVEKYVSYCLDSIINQTYKNLEIIIVNDGSTDTSAEICKKYSKKDNRIIYISQENGGLAAARNAGLKLVTGEFICFLDSDDYIHPDFISYLYNLLKEHYADISECDFMRISAEAAGNFLSIIEKENDLREVKELEGNNIDALCELYGPRLNPYVKKVVVWNKMYRKELFNNITFPVGKLHEDEFTTYQILYKIQKIVSSNRILHAYIQTGNSIMRQAIKQKRIDDNLMSYMEAIRFFKSKNNNELEAKCKRRYLEYCLELAAKAKRGNGEEREEQVENLKQEFLKRYIEYMDFINQNTKSNEEMELVRSLEEAYKNIKNNNESMTKYYDIINEIQK